MNTWSYCPHCGSTLRPIDTTCTACGAATPTAPTQPSGEPSAVALDAGLAAVTEELRDAIAPQLQLLRALGQGGMGTVFLARDPALKRMVVVKVLSPALAHDAAARRRFEREAESAAAVSHPNVVSVHQVGTLPRSGTSYFVMQHVDGQTLAQAFAAGTVVPEQRAKRIVGEVASALAAAHGRGLVHRDIKPSNVMLERETDRVVVLDFGISAAVDPERQSRETRLTVRGSSIGTPQYMSPEQAAGEDATDRSDVYSLGLVAFELLTGRPPFEETSAMALAAAHINKEPPSVLSLRPDVDPGLAELVGRCLAKEPSQRPAAAEVQAFALPNVRGMIEWPPPGLEVLRRDAQAFGESLRSLGLWSVLYLAVIGYVSQTPEAVIVIGLGAAMLGWSLLRLLAAGLLLVQSTWHAARQRYTARTIVEVLFDQSGDRGDLLSGIGAFGAIPPVRRARLLRLRFASAATRLGAFAFFGLSPILWFVVAQIRHPVDRAGLVSALEIVTVLAVGGAMWVISRLLDLPEHRVTRRRLLAFTLTRRLPPVKAEVVQSWSAAAGRQAGRGPGPARLLSPTLAFLTGLAIAGIVAVAMFCGPALLVVWEFSGTSYVDRASVLRAIQDAEALPPWATTDSAFRAAWPEPTAEDLANADAAVRQYLAPPFDGVLDGAPNLGLVANRLARGLDTLLLGAPLAPATRAVLERVVHSTAPLQPLVHLAGADIETVRAARQTGSEGVEPGYATETMRRWFQLGARARGILALAAGDVAAAERAAREAIVVGHLQLALERGPGIDRPGHALHAAALLRAAGMVGGRPSLAEEGERLVAYLRAISDLNLGYLSYEKFSALGGALADPPALTAAAARGLPPNLRMLLASSVVRGWCSNPREMLFGIAPARRANLERAGQALADLPEADDWLVEQLEQLDLADGGPWTSVYSRFDRCF